MSRAGSPSEVNTCPYLMRAGRGARVSHRTTRTSRGPVSVISIGTPSSLPFRTRRASRENRARRRDASRRTESNRAWPSRTPSALPHRAAPPAAAVAPCSCPAKHHPILAGGGRAPGNAVVVHTSSPCPPWRRHTVNVDQRLDATKSEAARCLHTVSRAWRGKGESQTDPALGITAIPPNPGGGKIPCIEKIVDTRQRRHEARRHSILRFETSRFPPCASDNLVKRRHRRAFDEATIRRQGITSHGKENLAPGGAQVFGRNRSVGVRPHRSRGPGGGRRSAQGRHRLRLADLGDRLDQAAQPGGRSHRRYLRRAYQRDRDRQCLGPASGGARVPRAREHRSPADIRDQLLARDARSRRSRPASPTSRSSIARG